MMLFNVIIEASQQLNYIVFLSKFSLVKSCELPFMHVVILKLQNFHGFQRFYFAEWCIAVLLQIEHLNSKERTTKNRFFEIIRGSAS